VARDRPDPRSRKWAASRTDEGAGAAQQNGAGMFLRFLLGLPSDVGPGRVASEAVRDDGVGTLTFPP
jgi:hypothetical protein